MLKRNPLHHKVSLSCCVSLYCSPSLSDAWLYYDSIISIRIKEEIREKYLGKFWVPNVQNSFFSSLLSGKEKTGLTYGITCCMFVSICERRERNRTMGRAVTVHTSPHLIISASQYICLFNDALCLWNYTASKSRSINKSWPWKSMFKMMVN